MSAARREYSSQSLSPFPARFAAIVEENQVAQRAAGHWGVPMMVFGEEAFFGQDRFDQLKWRMEQQGMARR